MNCCNEFGQCRQGHGCPARVHKEAPTREQLIQQLQHNLEENKRITKQIAKLDHAEKFKAAVDAFIADHKASKGGEE